jgi:hypothetical protein
MGGDERGGLFTRPNSRVLETTFKNMKDWESDEQYM